MSSNLLCTDAPAASPSTYELLFKHNKHFQPQDDDAPSSTEEIKREVAALAKQPMLLADLHRLQELTQQLQAATLDTACNNHDDDASESTPAEDVAALYCRRAAALLAFADYDATTKVPLDALAAGLSSSDPTRDEANQAPAMLEAVRQALQDSQAAVELTSASATIAEAHLLAAQCSRSLGELAHARAFTALAAAALPGSTTISHLEEQLAVEAQAGAAVAAGSSFMPKLSMTSELIAAMTAASEVQIEPRSLQQQDDDEDNNDQPEPKGSPTCLTTLPSSPTVEGSFWPQAETYFQVLEEATNSRWLEKVESLVHHNVHHCCASPPDIRRLDQALQSTFALLALLLRSNGVCTVLGLDMTDDAAARTLEKLTEAVSTSPQTLVKNRTARKWIVEAFASAVRLAAASTSIDMSAFNRSDSSSMLIVLARDTLLMLMRLLQASGSWRQCIVMAHHVAYTKMSYDLSTSLSSTDSDAVVKSRLEMQCADAYASALLQRSSGHEEALQLYRASLQAALQSADHVYELRARFQVARALRDTDEPEAAHAELTQLLMRSRALCDSHMEALTQYELGEGSVRRGDLEKAQEHFHETQTLCNRTADCANTWRPRSIQQAIAFYARLKPSARRGAIRCSISTLARSIDEDQDNASDAEADEQEEEEDVCDQPKTRRPAFCFKKVSPPRRSLLSTLMNTTENASAWAGEKPRRSMDWRESMLAVTPSQSQMQAATVGQASDSSANAAAE